MQAIDATAKARNIVKQKMDETLLKIRNPEMISSVIQSDSRIAIGLRRWYDLRRLSNLELRREARMRLSSILQALIEKRPAKVIP
jgi:hypothetical protein